MNDRTEPVPNAHRLAHGLVALAEEQRVHDFEVFAYLVFNWWDKIKTMFERPDPLVEVQWSDEHDEIKLHIGGGASPPRTDQPALHSRAGVLMSFPKRGEPRRV